MTSIDRKAAARAFRERVPVRGIFAMRCATGGVWVGPSRDLDAEEGRLRFFLRSGSHRDRALQSAYTTQGGEAFTFEVLERLDPDVAAMNLADTLKARTAHWAATLHAPILLP
jgi:hypothetical protein